MAVKAHRLARQVPEEAEFGPPGLSRSRCEDAPVQDLAGGLIQFIEVAHRVSAAARA